MADSPVDGDLTDIATPRLLLYALTIVCAVALLVAASTSTAAFGAYNAQWDGTSQLESQATAVGSESRIIRNTTAYTRVPAETTVALVLSPSESYTAAETERIRAFVAAGGTLVVAEDVGPGGNALLRALGADARVNGTRLRDETHYYRSPNFPVATAVRESPYTRNVSQLTLNYGTALEPGNATVLVRSSEVAYLDTDGDEELDDNETLARRPVVAVESLGAGQVVTVADPSLFINAMLERPGNRQFTRTLFGLGDRVLLDYSHTAGIPPLSLALLIVREAPLLQALGGLVGVLLVAAWSRGVVERPARDEPTVATPAATADDLRVYLQQEHPEWDDEQVARVAAALRRENPSGEGARTATDVSADQTPAREQVPDTD